MRTGITSPRREATVPAVSEVRVAVEAAVWSAWVNAARLSWRRESESSSAYIAAY